MHKITTPTIDDRLVYRRQYFIGPRFVSQFKSWNKIKIGKKTHITAHPDLPISTIRNNDTELALLGFMFDSENYKSTNDSILNDIVKKSESFDDVVNATFQYAGRWILIYTNNQEEKLFHDPGGLRQIFYCSHNSETWCSAQPHVLAELSDNKKKNNIELLSFLKSKSFELNERSIVGHETIYENIYHLYPNHYLNLIDSTTKRYWPTENIASLSIDEVVDKSCNMLIELLKAAKHRYQIAQIVTAGWDTRVLLAASKAIKSDNYYFVHQLPDMDYKHEDIYVPQELSAKNDFSLDVIECKNYDLEFDKINMQNVSLVQSEKKKLQYYNYLSQFENTMIISGNASPLIKELHPPVDKVSALNLARLLHYHNEKYAIMAISEWLDHSIEFANWKNVSIEKLFYWEIRFGTWAPMYNSELDIATEEFSPFNCRNLINIGLATPANYRIKPTEIFYTKIIHNLWPELLETPINPISYNLPRKKILKLVPMMMSFLSKFGLYKITRFFYRKFILR